MNRGEKKHLRDDPEAFGLELGQILSFAGQESSTEGVFSGQEHLFCSSAALERAGNCLRPERNC